MIEYNGIIIPYITHANVVMNQWGRVEITMHEGYVFWNKREFLDESGEFVQPSPEDISYAKWGSFAPSSVEYLVEAVESEAPADQSNGADDETVTQ